ncbi:MAG: diguanylate cyclase, partial [Sciscionella sp.]|nr:diguanylate cyclase [Sciscionella sp.]
MTDDSTGPQANRGRPADNTATRARFSRDFGTRWASVAVRTSQVPFTRTELVDELTAASAALIDAITADPPRTEVGAAIGRQLVNLYLTGTEALGDSIRLLYTELLGGEGSPIADTARNRAAVTAVITPLTTGYIDALRESLFSDQELVKMAAFQARDNESIRRQESEARFRGVFDNAPIGIGIADKTGKILQVNQAMADMLGRSIADLTGRDSGKVVTDVVVPKDQQKILANFPQLVGGDIERYTAEVEMAATEDADPVWTNVSVTLVRDASGRPSFPMMLVENLSEQHLLGRALQQQVVTDELTKLATARRLESELRDLVLNAKPGRRIALCLFDIDGFRVINDGLGKQVGDVMLKRMADKLREYFPEPDNLVARLAGDGFAVLVRRPRTDAAVISAVDQLLEDVAEAHYPDPSSEVSAAICCSVGIVLDSTPGMQPDELQRAAEVTLHRAKMSGKAQWVVFDPETYQRDKDRLTLGALLPGALENGQIVIRYQPARQLAEKSVAAIRSVLQWEHPTLGVLDDQEFIGLAEETGLVVALGKELIERVCAHAAEWQRRLGE